MRWILISALLICSTARADHRIEAIHTADGVIYEKVEETRIEVDREYLENRIKAHQSAINDLKRQLDELIAAEKEISA